MNPEDPAEPEDAGDEDIRGIEGVLFGEKWEIETEASLRLFGWVLVDPAVNL